MLTGPLFVLIALTELLATSFADELFNFANRSVSAARTANVTGIDTVALNVRTALTLARRLRRDGRKFRCARLKRRPGVQSRAYAPVTLLWGVHDMVSPIRVANYVWSTALKTRSAPASYWLFPCANHYLVHDQANDLAAVMRGELGQAPKPAPFNLTSDACSPVLVDRNT